MRHSIRVRLILTLATMIVFTIFFYWLMNIKFLPNYYELSKKKAIVNVFSEVNKIYKDKKETNVTNRFQILSIKKNMDIYIFEQNYLGLDFKYPVYQNLLLNQEQFEDVYNRIIQYGNYNFSYDEALKFQKKHYIINNVIDERLGSRYLELCGKLKNDNWIYLRTNYQSINESVKISNQFLTYVGFLVMLISISIMFYISRSFTNPILELSEIAEKMSNLDFDVKYSTCRQDEIGMLGCSINILSEKLKDTISELKSANNELQTDIENKIQIDEMRKEFLSNVSHELKTPIALIQGYAEGLQENINDDAESRDFYCEVIMDEANKMNKMVKKLLSLNQIEFGNNQISFERFDIVSLLQTVLSSSEILFQQKEVTLKFAEYGTVFVWADEYMVEEVITNYITNAINHVSGEKIIEVKLKVLENVVRISVFNTGENIPEEDLDKVWIKFFKVDKARTREYGGSGIGLSIVKAIMTSFNRECGVKNHDNGVEFWFELDIKND